MADEFKKRVVIVDTSNEIGGDGDVPHPGELMAVQLLSPLSYNILKTERLPQPSVGPAACRSPTPPSSTASWCAIDELTNKTRFLEAQLSNDTRQVEAVENHMPEVVIVDEIGTEAEALACRTIAERGVQLVGTAHGRLLENLLKNPTLSDLIGGIQSVTLGELYCCVPRRHSGTDTVDPSPRR